MGVTPGELAGIHQPLHEQRVYLRLVQYGLDPLPLAIQMGQKRAIIIGAGPAGLTAAYELATRTDIIPIVVEKSGVMGGISRTVNYKGNRIDIGGHRFFSKSSRVMDWWLKILPLEEGADPEVALTYQGRQTTVSRSEDLRPANSGDRVMLVRPRKSRIYYLRRFFTYPISLSIETIRNLGLWRTLKIGASYFRSVLFPVRPEATLEQFFINRFGRELYATFFKSYTEKVWGVPCSAISAEWGAQRVKGLSVLAAITHAAKKVFGWGEGIGQSGTETSLIERFLYPKFGPGQMWEEVARLVVERGGKILTNCTFERIIAEGERIRAIEASGPDGRITLEGDYFFSTAPVKELMQAFNPPPPRQVLEVSEGLVYRDFITVGLLVNGLRIQDTPREGNSLIRDNWIYIQEPDVRLGRLQVFNNWSPFLIADPGKVWLGLEYFCNEGDDLWQLPDERMAEFAVEELSRIGIIDRAEVIDSTVIRMEKTYPAYFGTYPRFGVIREYVDRFDNLVLIGRNGMHRYNNQDHSMLTAMMAVDGIIAGAWNRNALWDVNTESDYHEQRSA